MANAPSIEQLSCTGVSGHSMRHAAEQHNMTTGSQRSVCRISSSALFGSRVVVELATTRA